MVPAQQRQVPDVGSSAVPEPDHVVRLAHGGCGSASGDHAAPVPRPAPCVAGAGVRTLRPRFRTPPSGRAARVSTRHTTRLNVAGSIGPVWNFRPPAASSWSRLTVGAGRGHLLRRGPRHVGVHRRARCWTGRGGRLGQRVGVAGTSSAHHPREPAARARSRSTPAVWVRRTGRGGLQSPTPRVELEPADQHPGPVAGMPQAASLVGGRVEPSSRPGQGGQRLPGQPVGRRGASTQECSVRSASIRSAPAPVSPTARVR